MQSTPTSCAPWRVLGSSAAEQSRTSSSATLPSPLCVIGSFLAAALMRPALTSSSPAWGTSRRTTRFRAGQWTLSFPHRVRWVLLKDVGLLSDVLTVFLRAVFA